MNRAGNPIPDSEYRAIHHLESPNLPHQCILYEAEYETTIAYNPSAGLVSLVVATGDGKPLQQASGNIPKSVFDILQTETFSEGYHFGQGVTKAQD